MLTLGRVLYNLSIFFYTIAIKLASPFNPKARLWVQGRHQLLEDMRQTINSSEKIVWMHCSSLGEFEQGRPVMEKLKSENRGLKVLLTFFSPSGYEVRKNYSGADYIFYLPADTASNAKTFFDIVKPSLILFVKYEFWNYYLQEAKKRVVPLLLISGIFRKSQPFFKPYNGFHRAMLSCFTHLFVQNQDSVKLLNSIGFQNVSVAGDTRFDRVIEIAEKFEPILFFQNFCAGYPVVVAGSTWREDDEKLYEYANTRADFRFIVAPHNITANRLAECRRLYKNSIVYSGVAGASAPKSINTLIIDSIGLLSSLYKYASVCYVGGGFGKDGVHNVLEAAVYGKPVIFGPEYRKYVEAKELVAEGGGISVKNPNQLQMELDKFLSQGSEYLSACKASQNYVYSNRGSTDKIIAYIHANRLLTN